MAASFPPPALFPPLTGCCISEHPGSDPHSVGAHLILPVADLGLGTERGLRALIRPPPPSLNLCWVPLLGLGAPGPHLQPQVLLSPYPECRDPCVQLTAPQNVKENLIL